MTEEEATDFVGKENIGTQNELVQSITSCDSQPFYLNTTCLAPVNHHDFGLNHLGWSGVVTESFKSRKYYKLLSANRHSQGRNSNELRWTLHGLENLSIKCKQMGLSLQESKQTAIQSKGRVQKKFLKKCGLLPNPPRTPPPRFGFFPNKKFTPIFC